MTAAPNSTAEDDLIPLSALQHHLFCPRQCALIHVERIWQEDVATAEGRLLHERPDGGRGESRPGIKVARGISLRSFALGVAGKADVVEFHDSETARPYPVEYKRGRPKAHRADEVQLCAQAICLEEIFGVPLPRAPSSTVRPAGALRSCSTRSCATSPPEPRRRRGRPSRLGARPRRCACPAAAAARSRMRVAPTGSRGRPRSQAGSRASLPPELSPESSQCAECSTRSM